MKKTAPLIAAMIALTAGCASTKVAPVQDISIKRDTTALEKLKEISIEARHELRILAKAREAEAQESMTPDQHKQRFFQAVHVPKGFEKIEDFYYVGSALKAGQELAQRAGYHFTQDGKAPVNMPFVNIVIHDQPLNEALKELGMQTGKLIRVEVHEAANPPIMVFKYPY